MKFKMSDLTIRNADSMVSHVFLNCVDLNSDLPDRYQQFKKDHPTEQMEVDMTLLIDGSEVPVDIFFDVLWKQYSSLIKEEANNLLEKKMAGAFSDKINEMTDTLANCQDVINSWAKEIDWEVQNPFIESKTK